MEVARKHNVSWVLVVTHEDEDEISAGNLPNVLVKWNKPEHILNFVQQLTVIVNKTLQLVVQNFVKLDVTIQTASKDKEAFTELYSKIEWVVIDWVDWVVQDMRKSMLESQKEYEAETGQKLPPWAATDISPRTSNKIKQVCNAFSGNYYGS